MPHDEDQDLDLDLDDEMDKEEGPLLFDEDGDDAILDPSFESEDDY